MSGSVRGAGRKARPYRDLFACLVMGFMAKYRKLKPEAKATFQQLQGMRSREAKRLLAQLPVKVAAKKASRKTRKARRAKRSWKA